jgi:hypothetical protein
MLEKKGHSDLMNSATASVSQQQLEASDKTLLVGNWIRTDADYKIQITEVNDEGNMKAGYFNPSSIHVAHANVKRDGDMLQMFIELRDQNYPGSNYQLNYIKDRDVLSGEYFQAVERRTYKVEFAKQK